MRQTRAPAFGEGTKGNRKEDRNERSEKKKSESARERFWAPSKREQTKGSRRIWNGKTGANALAQDTEDSSLVSRA